MLPLDEKFLATVFRIRLSILVFTDGLLIYFLGEFKLNKKREKFSFTTQQIALLGVMIGLSLALSRVSISLGPNNRLSFGFIINAIVAILYGPWVAGFASAAEDLLQSFLFGVQGQFFIGFTLTAFVGSFIYGLFLHRKKITWKHVLGAVVLNTIFSNLFLNTLWIHLLYRTPIFVLLAGRIPQNILMAPIRFGLIYLMTQNRQLKQIYDRYAVGRKE